MADMFNGAVSFDQDMSSWDVQKVRDMRYMFLEAADFDQDLCQWGSLLEAETIVNDMFKDTRCEDQDTPDLLDGPGPFCFNCARTRGQRCFETNQQLRDAVIEYVGDSSKNTAVARRYGHPIRTWCVSGLEDFTGIFDAMDTFSESLDGWDMSSATTLSGMFHNAKRFNGQISSWDVSRVTDFSNLFRGAERFNRNIGSWDTSRAVVMDSVFENALKFNKDLGWNVRNVVSMRSMFRNAARFDGSLETWNTRSVLFMDSMFEEGEFR